MPRRQEKGRSKAGKATSKTPSAHHHPPIRRQRSSATAGLPWAREANPGPAGSGFHLRGPDGLLQPASSPGSSCTRADHVLAAAAALYPFGGSRYFIYKAFLAVSAAAAPFATVSVTRPASARLVYGSPSRMGALFSTRSGLALRSDSRTAVRLPVCGPRFTGFTGGVIVTGPACVTFTVSSPSR